MPIEIKDVKDGLGSVISAAGIIQDQEYIKIFKKYLTQDREKFKKYRYSLADSTAVTEAKISANSVRLISELCIQAAAVNPYIVIGSVTNLDYIYGLTRMSHTLRDDSGWESKAFRNRLDAEAWVKNRVKEKYDIDDLVFE